jgi:hypothetical protein
VPAKCRRRTGQRIASLAFQFRREPRPLKESHLTSFRRGHIVLCGQKFRQECVRSLGVSRRRFVKQ